MLREIDITGSELNAVKVKPVEITPNINIFFGSEEPWINLSKTITKKNPLGINSRIPKINIGSERVNSAIPPKRI